MLCNASYCQVTLSYHKMLSCHIMLLVVGLELQKLSQHKGLLICQSLCFNKVLTVVLEYIYFVWTLFYCRSSRSTVWLWCWEFRWVDTSCWDPGHWLHAVWARLDDRWTEWQARNLSLQFCEDYSWEYHFGYVHKGYVPSKFTMLSM